MFESGVFELWRTSAWRDALEAHAGEPHGATSAAAGRVDVTRAIRSVRP